MGFWQTTSFEEVYRRHFNAVFRFTLHCAGRKDIAEEIVSETFLALFRNFDAIELSQLPGWLITVAKNRARDYWRRRTIEEMYLETIRDSCVPAGERRGAEWFLNNTGLKPVHRVCLTLRYAEGLTRLEIAETLGLSESQVKGTSSMDCSRLEKLWEGANKHEPSTQTTAELNATAKRLRSTILSYRTSDDSPYIGVCPPPARWKCGRWISRRAASRPSIIASIWNVPDQPANRLLQGFYASWLRGSPRIDALRAAQLQLLADLRAGRVRVGTPAGALILPEDPMFWAGFLLMGEP